MKNNKYYKFLLSGLVLITAIVSNINHCHKNSTSASLKLNDVFRISTCQAEPKDDEGDQIPIVYSPYNPDEDTTEEEDEEVMRRQQYLD